MKNNRTIILAIETASRLSSVALLDEGEKGGSMLAASPVERSEGLAAGVENLLRQCGVEREAIGLVAVSSGPGSLTGTRNGRAFAKGLSDALRIDSREVSLIEAMSSLNLQWSNFCVAVDAGRREIAVRRFDAKDAPLPRCADSDGRADICGPATFRAILARCSNEGDGVIVAPDLFVSAEYRKELDDLVRLDKLITPEFPLAAVIGAAAIGKETGRR